MCLMPDGTAGMPPPVLSTLTIEGKRKWLYPRPAPGRLLTARRFVAYALIAIFTLIPHIELNGKPLILLHVATRHFTIFGKTFLPTDTVLLALFMVSVFIAIFLLTAILGRVWCGWACPQTVYMEFVYRPIERLFDGTPGRTKKGWLQTSGVGTPLKYGVYLLISLFLAHTFLSYFVGVDALRQWMVQSPLEHPGPFILVMGVTAAMMFNFAYFREQTCIVACPYGRFQSVMLDRNSLIVSYDAQRGEPRGRAVKGSAEPKGDCIDCKMCVTTCPTGIDIRNGLQMECINCAQCIDACNTVMTKIGKPEGLIRYGSQAAMAGEKSRFIRPRIIAYPLVLAIVLSAFTITLLGQDTSNVLVMRGLGKPFTEISEGQIANPIRVKVINRNSTPMTYTVSASGIAGLSVISEDPEFRLKPWEQRTVPLMVVAPAAAFARTGSAEVTITIADETHTLKAARYRLMGPGTRAHHDDDKDKDKHEREGDEEGER